MAEEFGNAGADQATGEGQGFGSNAEDKAVEQHRVDITPEELQALRTKSEAAQAHIERLEGENAGLRGDKASLADALASTSAVEDVLQRIKSGEENTPKGTDPDEVAQIVDQRLQQQITQRQHDENLSQVWGKLKDIYQDDKVADQAVVNRANELGMTADEATDLAKRNPTMFSELFLPKAGSVTQRSVNSAASTNTNAVANSDGTNIRDKAYYNEMRRKNRTKFNSIETQKQMWRDLYGTS